MESKSCDAASSPCDVTVGCVLQQLTWHSGRTPDGAFCGYNPAQTWTITTLYMKFSWVLCITAWFVMPQFLVPLLSRCGGFLWYNRVFCIEAAVSMPMKHREHLLTQQWRVLDFLNGFGRSYQSIYVKMLKKIMPNPLSLLDYYHNVKEIYCMITAWHLMRQGRTLR